jgi:hypothetical protein
MRLSSVFAALALASIVSGAEPPALRYVRPSKDKYVLESLVTESRKDGLLVYTSLTDRGSVKMTLTIRMDAKHRVKDAEAVLESGGSKKSAKAVFREKDVALTRAGKTETLNAARDAIVTTAPDWSDIFWAIRRYDRAKGGKQGLAGLWIHPVEMTRKLTFTVEPEKDETIEAGGKKLALKRFRVTLRSGAYLVWADSAGRVYKLMPPGKPGSAVILAGYEKATDGLR